MKEIDVISFLESIVNKGGPEYFDYEDLLNHINVIHKFEYKINNGTSFMVNKSEKFHKFLNKHHDIFESTASMQGFVRSKPHGYSGDFEVIERTYNYCTSQQEHIVRWDNFYHSAPGAKAVRNRGGILRNLIQDNLPSKIISVGCGPAIDVVEALENNVTPKEVVLLDNDQNAIKRAKTNCSLFNNKDIRIEYVHKNALRYKDINKYDLIWSSGLFDYLNDKVAIFLLKKFREMVAPGGTIAVGNFGPYHPSRSYLEVIGKWFLNHRTETQLLYIAKEAGFESSRITVKSDETGVNLFLFAYF